MKQSMRKLLFGIVLVALVVVVISQTGAEASGGQLILQDPNKNFCAANPDAQWATINEYAWFSNTHSGNWQKDDWFYRVDGNQRVVVLNEKDGYYLTCFDFGSDAGYEPIVGWVQKERILLDD